MFLCSNSSAVGLWLSRLRKNTRRSFWTISYPPFSPCSHTSRSQRLEFLLHPVLCKTDSHHRRLLSSSNSAPGKAPCVMSRRGDPPPPSSLLAPPQSRASRASRRGDSPHRSPFLWCGLLTLGLCLSAPALRPELAPCHVCADPVKSTERPLAPGRRERARLSAKNNSCSSSCPHPSPPEPC